MVSINNTLLRVLLDDMGQFLGETLVKEKLSMYAEIHRLGLLERLLPHIDGKLHINLASTPHVTLPFIKMNEVTDEEECVNRKHLEEHYEDATEIMCSRPSSSSSSSEQSDNSIKFTPSFTELRTSTIKCGPLWRKEKVVFLDQWRKYWAGMYGHHLLLYCSEREVKATYSLNIQGYVARPAPNCIKDMKKKSITFEIVCPGKKEHKFFARTMKDMEQWVSSICQASIQHILNSSPAFPSRLPSQTHTETSKRKESTVSNSESEMHNANEPVSKLINDTDINSEYVQCNEEDIYHDIADHYHRNSALERVPNPETKCPLLPPRRLLPSLPKDSLSDEDSTYDDIGVSNQNDYLNAKVLCVKQMNVEINPQPSVKSEAFEEDEDFYHDIGVHEEPPKEMTITRMASGSDRKLQQPMKYGVQNAYVEEEIYDDIVENSSKEKISFKSNDHVNMILEGVKERQPQNANEEEEIYDDIGAFEKMKQPLIQAKFSVNEQDGIIKEPSKKIKSPVFQLKSSGANEGNIQNRIKKLEASLPNKNLPPGGHKLTPKLINQFQPNTSALQRLMKNNNEIESIQPSTQMPAVNQQHKRPLIKELKPNTSNLHNRMKISTVESTSSLPQNSPSSKPPPLPARSPVKR